MSNFDNIIRIWNNLDEVKRGARFSGMSNTDFFRTLLGFHDLTSGLSNLQARIMQDLPDDPKTYQEFQEFLKGANTLSAVLESGDGFDDNALPSEIFSAAKGTALNEIRDDAQSKGHLEISDLAAFKSLATSSVTELLRSGHVLSFSRRNKDKSHCVITVENDSDGYIAFLTQSDMLDWLFSCIATQDCFNTCTEFEKAVVADILRDVKSNCTVVTPRVFIGKKYSDIMIGRFSQEEQKLFENFQVTFNETRVTVNKVKVLAGKHTDEFGTETFVEVVE